MVISENLISRCRLMALVFGATLAHHHGANAGAPIEATSQAYSETMR
jgi:hypothetical protein